MRVKAWPGQIPQKVAVGAGTEPKDLKGLNRKEWTLYCWEESVRQQLFSRIKEEMKSKRDRYRHSYKYEYRYICKYALDRQTYSKHLVTGATITAYS